MDSLKNGIVTHIKLYIENRTESLRKLVSDVKSSTIEKLLSLYTETKILLKRKRNQVGSFRFHKKYI